ncbi:MAG TPA: type III-A CRISPR-associated RAMP protein Csm5 [Bacteroidales bacterium]|nr:type III-A CRISPR-associated RAMP protein Csm5 [Bacteroidales bacterium]HPO65437.1 type III-A CRISPR-associated RAMP protein Csm5 [Bacteroidales bacterium]
MKTNLTYDLTLQVVTPVHIGAGTDKKWIKGFDYFRDNDGNIKVYDINQLKAVDKETIDFITSKILPTDKNSNPIREILSNRKINISPLLSFKHTREPQEIFSHIRNGLYIPYIPGSSIKGAIRSAILGYLYQNNDEIKRLNLTKLDDEVFGDIENSIMRFLQVTDAYFKNEAIKLYDTKIYSLSSNYTGAWKHQRKGSRNRFDDKDFVSTYECIDIHQKSTFRINITEQIIKLLKNKKHRNTEKVIVPSNYTDPLKEIFRMINEQTQSYLDKEINFFEKHKGDKYDIILNQYRSLKNIVDDFINNKNPKALLHLGSGSGFHGITGDWQFNTHIINGINNNKGRNENRGQINGKDAAKTRRLIFKETDDDEYVFTPFGFIVLSLNNEALPQKTYFETFESIDNNYSPQSNNSNFKKKTTENYQQPTDEIEIYNQHTQECTTIEKLSEIASNKYVWAELVSIEKNNSKAKVVLEGEEMICQIHGKLVKYLNIGQKIKAKITSFKDNKINSLSINIY